MKYFKYFLFIFAVVSFSSCERVKSEFEGVLITNCGRDGLDDFQTVYGRVNTLGPCTDLVKVPMFEQSGDIEPMKIYCKDGGEFTVDPSYSYQPIRGQGKFIAYNYKQFSDDAQFLDAIEDNILNKRVRDIYLESARIFTTDSLLNNMNAYENIVEQRLTEIFQESHFTLVQVNSGLKPPATLAKAIELRNQEVQEAQRERNRMEREKARLAIELEKAATEVEIAKKKAEAYIEESKGLTPQILQKIAIEGWIENNCPVPYVVSDNSPFVPFDAINKKK